jgi:hypothetical protein
MPSASIFQIASEEYVLIYGGLSGVLIDGRFKLLPES